MKPNYVYSTVLVNFGNSFEKHLCLTNFIIPKNDTQLQMCKVNTACRIVILTLFEHMETALCNYVRPT